MANDINVITLTGRLTKDATCREVSDRKYYSLSVAVGKRVKQGDEWVDQTSFIDVTYGTKSTTVGQALTKGKFVMVSGSLKQERWESNGQNHSRVVVIADKVIPSASEAGKENGKQAEVKEVWQGSLIDNFEDTEEDIPF